MWKSGTPISSHGLPKNYVQRFNVSGLPKYRVLSNAFSSPPSSSFTSFPKAIFTKEFIRPRLCERVCRGLASHIQLRGSERVLTQLSVSLIIEFKFVWPYSIYSAAVEKAVVFRNFRSDWNTNKSATEWSYNFLYSHERQLARTYLKNSKLCQFFFLHIVKIFQQRFRNIMQRCRIHALKKVSAS